MSIPNLLPDLLVKTKKVQRKKNEDANYVPHESDMGSDDDLDDDDDEIVTVKKNKGARRNRQEKDDNYVPTESDDDEENEGKIKSGKNKASGEF
jgi:hypothetical protein